MSGLFKHVTTGTMCRLIGYARNAKEPRFTQVVYAQEHDAYLECDPTVRFPSGTLWHQGSSEFFKEFCEHKIQLFPGNPR
jgi:hypothetical protein